MLEAYREKFDTMRTVLLWGGIYFISQAIITTIIHAMDPLVFIKAQTTFSKDMYLAIYNQCAVRLA